MSFSDSLSVGLVLFALFFLLGVMRRGRRLPPDEEEKFQEFKQRQLYGSSHGRLYGPHEGFLYPGSNAEENPPQEEKIPMPERRKAG
jgi:hypothetical protein